MAANDSAEIDAKVKKSLDGIRFQSSCLTPLSGGSVNWTYLATLSQPLDDGTTEVMVKHGETHMMTKPEVALTLIRCFLEYLPRGISLKGYILKYYDGLSSEPLDSEVRQIGKSLGSWLKSFTHWSESQPALRSIAAENVEAQGFRHMLEFGWLAERVLQYPTALSDAEDVFVEVEKAAAAEIRDGSKLQVVHGDFWTGNVLMPDAPIRKGSHIPMLVVDWEMAHLGVTNLDFGEMIAELYTIWLYRRIPAALWMMEAFVGAYGEVSQEDAFRIAVQVGAHIVCVTSIVGWGAPEEVEEAVVIGRDVIVHAWEKDRAWFEKGDLACLFRQVS